MYSWRRTSLIAYATYFVRRIVLTSLVRMADALSRQKWLAMLGPGIQFYLAYRAVYFRRNAIFVKKSVDRFRISLF